MAELRPPVAHSPCCSQGARPEQTAHNGGKRLSNSAATCHAPRCTHRRRGTHLNAGLVMGGATSNFVGVQNSFETAEAGGTGVLWYGGEPGRRYWRTVAKPSTGPQSAASWVMKAKSMGCPRGIYASTFSPGAVSTGNPPHRGLWSLGDCLDTALRRSALQRVP